MSDEPRNLYAGSTYVVLRHVTDGACDLPPDADTRRLVGFVTGWSQERVVEAELHVLRVLPNLMVMVMTHWTDPSTGPPTSLNGIPAFLKETDRLIAENRNVRTGRTGESVWATRGPVLYELSTAEDLWDVLVQIELLHRTAGIAERRYRDPGLYLSPRDAGKTHGFERPHDFKCAVGPRPPERTTVTLSRPPLLAEMTTEEFDAEFDARCEAERERLDAQERRCLTRKELKSLDRSVHRPFPAFPPTSLLGRERPHWENHVVDSHDGDVARRNRQRRSIFLRRHRQALERLREHVRTGGDTSGDEVVFPVGTWGAWQYVHVCVERGPPDLYPATA